METRRNALEQCLQKMANHPVLQLDPDLRLFLESDTLSMEVSCSFSILFSSLN